MRTNYYWVNMNVLLYLLIDNAGGHGADECMKQYTSMLLIEFDIEIMHQVPRSRFSNILDLGVWAGL